jgi:hypothetical protein
MLWRNPQTKQGSAHGHPFDKLATRHINLIRPQHHFVSFHITSSKLKKSLVKQKHTIE